MGTSSVQHSPDTTRWQLVNRLYAQGEFDDRRLLSAVLMAARERYVVGLTEPAVLTRVRALLDVARAPSDVAEALTVAAQAIRDARAATVATGRASFYGDIADRALHTTLVEAAAGHAGSETDRRSLLQSFTGHLVGFAVDHVVSRDLSSYLGGPGLRTVGEFAELRRTLTTAARDLSDVPAAREAIGRASRDSDAWSAAVRAVWDAGTRPPERAPEEP